MPATPQRLNERIRTAVNASLVGRRVHTPEARLLAEHYDKLGVDDAMRVARLDPRSHLFGCRCTACDRTEQPCPWPECETVAEGRTFTKLRLAAHLEAHRKQARRSARVARDVRRKRMEPAGIEFLERLFGSEAASRLDLRGLRRFEETLLAATNSRGLRRRTRNAKIAEESLAVAQAAPDESSEFKARVPNRTAAVVYKFAIIAGMHPRAVTAALICWGIEGFVEQVRAAQIETPHVERALTHTDEPRAARTSFPAAEDA